MLDVCNCIDSFTSIITLSIYLPGFDCFNCIVMINLLNCTYVKIVK